jgi:hypothetical protein
MTSPRRKSFQSKIPTGKPRLQALLAHTTSIRSPRITSMIAGVSHMAPSLWRSYMKTIKSMKKANS